MEFNTTKTDEANAIVTATIQADSIKKQVDKLAKITAKSIDIQGFRKGKVPVAIVKQRYTEKLTQDAEGELIREILTNGLKELNISNNDIIGEPAIVEFDKQDDNSIKIKIEISCRPTVELGDYKALLPEIEEQTVTDDEVNERINQIAEQSSTLKAIETPREVQKGDFTIIDFEGFKDGVTFAGGQADKHSLEIGSNSFIPGFEDQVIGMKYEEEKEITVTFPEGYQAEDLAGAEVMFKVKLHEIQTKELPAIDDEFAKKILQNEENPTVDLLKEKILEQIKSEKTNQYYNDELKSAYLEALVKNIDFAIPATVLDQEINQSINNSVSKMSEDEINILKDDKEKIEQMREDFKPEASDSVKATFIVDALAKAENINISDEEVSQTIYYEAMMQGQDGQALIKQYEEAGYLPAIKMSLIEQKVITKLLDEKAGK
jgi:trigger factor